ncbi:MAG TPA: fibronectin type III domain-containing protein [Candidatus Sulfotelmatobacter sp.]
MRFSRLSWLALMPLLFTGCATIAPPQPPSLDLPKPPADLHAARKGDRVILTWTIPQATTDRLTIRSVGPTLICRTVAADLRECGTPVGETPGSNNSAGAGSAKPKPTASYTDTLPPQIESNEASAEATYAVEVLNHDRRGAGLSNQVRVPLIHTLPAPGNFQASVTGQGVVLSWAGRAAPALPGVRYVYRVYRRVQGEPHWTLVGEAPIAGEQPVSVTDPDIEWEKTYEYRADAVTLVGAAAKPETQVEGDDSATVSVLAHDVFPPAVPSGLQAVFSGPGQKLFVDLVWAPVSDIDLSGYNVYRHEAGAAAEKINTEPVKTPSYRDTTVEPGRKYFYSVSSIDVRGNESQRSDEASETVP